MKKIEVLITDTKNPKLTVTPDRVTIKHNGKKDYTKEINFLKNVAEQLHDTTLSLRGNLITDRIKNGIRMTKSIERHKKEIVQFFEYN